MYQEKYTPEFSKGAKCGKLTIEREASVEERPETDRSHIYYVCTCECGSTTTIKKHDFVRRHKLSCGCHRKQVATRSLRKWYRNGNVNPNRDFVGDISGAFWCRLRSNAKSRGFDVKITRQEAWNLFLEQDKKCNLTGVQLELSLLTSEEDKNTASVDRIDSSKDYTLDNVQWVHKDVNLMKLDFSNSYFIEICKLVSETHK